MRAGQCRGSKRVEQSHGGAGGAEGEDRAVAPYKGKQSNGGGGGRRKRGQIAHHRAQAKQGGSDVTAEQGSAGRKTRGEG